MKRVTALLLITGILLSACNSAANNQEIIEKTESVEEQSVIEPAFDLTEAADIVWQKYGVPGEEDLSDLYFSFEGMHQYDNKLCYKFRARDHMDGYWTTACHLIVTPDGDVFELGSGDVPINYEETKSAEEQDTPEAAKKEAPYVQAYIDK